MKSRFGWVVLFSALLAGCGGDSGGINSPDYGGQLMDLDVVPADASVALGGTRQLQAIGTFTVAPSQDELDGVRDGLVQRDVTSGASWTVANTQIATVTQNGGLVTGVRLGATTVTAAFGDLTADAAITVTGTVLRQIVVTCTDGNADDTTCRTPVGATASLCAQGIYSDSSTPRAITGGTVSWVSSSTTVATVSPATGSCTTATGRAEGTTPIEASTVNEEGDTIRGNSPLTVFAAQLRQILRVEPAVDTVFIGATNAGEPNGDGFRAIGEYTGGAQAPIADTSLLWTTGAPAIATISNADLAVPASDGGIATGLGLGSTSVTATLRDGVGDPLLQRSAAAVLDVNDRVCVDPLLASEGATTAFELSPLCLACTVDNPDFIIDERLDTAAMMNFDLDLLGLLGFSDTLTAFAAEGVTLPGGAPAGFVIGRPTGSLTAVDVLDQIDVVTLLDGVEQESTANAANPLRVDLLGSPVIAGGDTVVSIDTTLPFDALSLHFTATLAAALDRVDVFSACAVVNPDAVTPPAAP
jgi:hypothetical protein